MGYLGVYFIVAFGIYAVSLGTHILLGYLLFRSLKRRYGSYYKSIGEPIVIMPPTNFSDTEDEFFHNYIRGLKSGVFVYSMVFKGVPKNFPKDMSLRKLAKTLRIVCTLTLTSFTIVIVVSYFFYRSSL